MLEEALTEALAEAPDAHSLLQDMEQLTAEVNIPSFTEPVKDIPYARGDPQRRVEFLAWPPRRLSLRLALATTALA